MLTRRNRKADLSSGNVKASVNIKWSSAWVERVGRVDALVRQKTDVASALFLTQGASPRNLTPTMRTVKLASFGSGTFHMKE